MKNFTFSYAFSMLLYTGAINFEDGPGLLFGQSVFRYHIFDCKGKGKCKRGFV